MDALTKKYTFFNLNENQKLYLDTINLPNINKNTYIEDSRKLKDFKIQTFGGYAKNQVSSSLDKTLFDGKIEQSVQFGFQLFFSGYVNLIWDKLFSFCAKNININNPLLPELLYQRLIKWKTITDNSKFNKDCILLLRNHPEIRNMLVELLVLCCISKKRKLDSGKKIKKTDFIIDNFKKNLESPNTNLIDKICKRGDPSEMKIAVNEFGYHIFKGNINKVIFWLNWILEWDKSNTKKYGKYECASRVIDGVESKYFTNVVWLIWDMVNLVKNIRLKNHDIGYTHKVNNQISHLWKLFIYKYSNSQKSRRMCYLLWSINYLINFIDWKIPLIDRPHILFQSLLNHDKLIQNMKIQQVNNDLFNSKLMNIAVNNNYMIPEKHKDYEKDKIKKIEQNKKKEMIKIQKEREKEAKKKKVDLDTLDKINAFNNINGQIF